MGDLNCDALDTTSNPLTNALLELNYTQIVTSPTHLMGNLIDHVYLSEHFSTSRCCSTEVVAVYYSDHDAVLLNFY